MTQFNRRQFLTGAAAGLGTAALASVPNVAMAKDLSSVLKPEQNPEINGILGKPHIPAKAKRVIYLFQSGGPSQLETFDYKPTLNKMHGQELPAEVRGGQVLTGMSAQQSSLPLAGSIYGFDQHGDSGAWVSELMPHTAKIVDDLCFVKSMHTDQINHDPAITFLQTGFPIAGRPSIGAWLNYALGTDNNTLPGFIVMVSTNAGGQPLYSRLWGNGFLPSIHQGVQFRGGKDPVLYLNNPPGLDLKDRSQLMQHLKKLNEEAYAQWHDQEIQSRIAQYEMAERMQSSIPDVTDFSDEPEWVFEMYGPDSRKPGTYAANCLLARRLAERNVKFTQLYHQGWDQHDNLPGGIKNQCKNTDQASAALVTDLKQRGLLDDTLVVWGGEFGRTNYSQGKLTETNYGRDHHPGCFTMWMAGGGVKAGFSHGETDEFGYNITKDPVHVHDFQATLLHLMGIDHEKLTYKYQGRRFRLTDVHGKIIKPILA
ncbi:DUF1501 domain-containing protein [Catenovulum adriaticum]|uniref:DUF1501 domain-containing protein n=1 Tax=Catenovulum adriaticum TaxID=2984846 RepID=A0ABY7ASG7_9ALTE|nr:DUF1501 domain-containing protein [Catenovulum sp. TS8]WAJ72066.1 DUF1501 domain-containing protein [Catenovulum sp. TS8]